MSIDSHITAFNPNEHQHPIYPRWEGSLRSFEMLVTSKDVTEAKKKKAMLLHHGGLDLQDIFYSIPDGDTAATGTTKLNSR